MVTVLAATAAQALEIQNGARVYREDFVNELSIPTSSF